MPIKVVRARVWVTERPVWSALVHQRLAIIGTMRPTTSASHTLRRPSLSIEAPRNGAVAITAQPEYWLQREITSWPLTGSPTTLWAT